MEEKRAWDTNRREVGMWDTNGREAYLEMEEKHYKEWKSFKSMDLSYLEFACLCDHNPTHPFKLQSMAREKWKKGKLKENINKEHTPSNQRITRHHHKLLQHRILDQSQCWLRQSRSSSSGGSHLQNDPSSGN